MVQIRIGHLHEPNPRGTDSERLHDLAEHLIFESGGDALGLVCADVDIGSRPELFDKQRREAEPASAALTSHGSAGAERSALFLCLVEGQLLRVAEREPRVILVVTGCLRLRPGENAFTPIFVAAEGVKYA